MSILNENSAHKENRSRQQKRLKRKLDETTSYEDLVKDWTQCCYLIPRKQRLCNMERAPNFLYCGAHRHLENPSAIEQSMKRIPCPLDPSHTIFERNLSSHLQICNAEKYRKELKLLPFYRENVNCSLQTENDIVKPTKKEENTENFVRHLLDKINRMFDRVPVISLLDDLEQKAPGFDKEVDLIGNPIRSLLGNTTNRTSFKHWKHIEQDICIVRQLCDHSLLNIPQNRDENEERSDREDVFIEYGAGRGLLGLSVNVINPHAALLFLERSGNRKKIDKFLTERKCKFQRFRLDIRHCYLPGLPFIWNSGSNDSILHEMNKMKNPQCVTIIAKHLCGVATDLAIRSLSHLPASSSHFSRGLAIATCCHHACIYEDYVGREAFFDGFGITKEEFDVMKYWSPWATLDRVTANRKILQRKTKTDFSSLNPSKDKENNDEELKDDSTELTEEIKAETKKDEEAIQENDENALEHAPGSNGKDKYRPIIDKMLSYDEMFQYGRKIKRIFDYGRLLYLQQHLNLETVIQQYCDESFSPEAYMIIAKEKFNS